jgi:hypothetical protein
MLHRRGRLAARFLAISLLAATLFTVDSVTSPSPAEARCVGVNNPVRSTYSYSGYLRASDTPGAGTCNNNDIYTGVLKDERADGYCVIVQFEITGQGWFLPTPPGSGIVCGAGQTKTFQWNDTNNNHQANQRFCIQQASNGTIVACGWGSDSSSGAKALNYGF